MHGSKVMLCIKKRDERTVGRTDERMNTPEAICGRNASALKQQSHEICQIMCTSVFTVSYRGLWYAFHKNINGHPGNASVTKHRFPWAPKEEMRHNENKPIQIY